MTNATLLYIYARFWAIIGVLGLTFYNKVPCRVLVCCYKETKFKLSQYLYFYMNKYFIIICMVFFLNGLIDELSWWHYIMDTETL